MSNQTPSTKKSNKELLDKILSEYEIGFITHGKNVDEHLRNFKQAIQAHVDKRVNEARIDEWKLISEVTHSANLVASSYLGKARDERIKQLRSEL